MSANDFPADLTSKSRDTIVQEFLRDFSLRMSQLDVVADTSPGSHPWVTAKTLADTLNASQANQTLIARRTLIKQLFGTKLDEYGNSRGLPRLQGSKSFGAVQITTSTGGTTIGAGNVTLVNPGNSLQYTATPGTYSNGSIVTIQSISLGEDTNCQPGTKLRFSSPSAGLAPDAIVTSDANGNGVSGGSSVETDEQYQDRLIDDFRNPQGNGNRSEVRALIHETSPNTQTNRPGHGVPVESGFVYPCALGPGSFAFTFTVPGKGVGRFPSGAQLATVEAYLKNYLGEDYSIFPCSIANEPIPTAVEVATLLRFVANVPGWADLDPFPRYISSLNGFPRIGVVTSSTVFQVTYSNYTGVFQPRNGQTICFYDDATRKFIPKRILSFTGTGPWTITVDTTNAASDTSTSPSNGQLCMPYSAKLEEINNILMNRYDKLGPGENVPGVLARDGELRGWRFPEPGGAYSYFIGTDIFQEILERSDVNSIVPLQGNNFSTTSGSPGVNVYLVVPLDVGWYPSLK